MYESTNYCASSQVITVPLVPPGRIVANLYAYPLQGSNDDQIIVSGDILCTCCGHYIPYACVEVDYDGVINVYEADKRGHFRIALPANKVCVEITFSHACFRRQTVFYSVHSGARELDICLAPK